ncbi:helix-turn-helix transcriptional regulator [Nocardia sp. BSTN01]|uniref:winged helix-turn-helix transcriptional regulator n=1 Tax=Nocardia sp. BSTN01 TaxID=2783665 RepID=UPI00188FA0E0|nr:helix-turn-helix domain-containing protein [Nocardia sp. BSTN01]MBF5000851.1 helix-turn-helix transcriptional regulator [Nocardia sp. BSTN01]
MSGTEQEQAAAVARRIFATLSTKWALAVLEAIGDRECRFAELHRAVEGISYKMLTQTLRTLEADGIVARYDHHTANPRVDYSLTAAGLDLLATVHQLCTWSRAHLRELLDEAPEQAGT